MSTVISMVYGKAHFDTQYTAKGVTDVLSGMSY